MPVTAPLPAAPGPAQIDKLRRAWQKELEQKNLNYPKEANPMTARWDDSDLQQEWGYQTQWAPDRTAGCSVDLAS